MRREIISITDSGTVVVPNGSVMMADFEIAHLLGATVPFVRGAIKRLLKDRKCVDCSGGVVSGHSLVPEFYGLDVIIAIAFQVDSYEADLLRKYIISKVTKCDLKQPPIFITVANNQIQN